MDNLVNIKVSELVNKFKTRIDRVNFCRELNFFFPPYPGFDSKYFLQFLQGKKKLLPLGVSSGFSFNYFTKSGHFTKSHILSFFQNDAELQQFLPDDIKPDSLNRDYLLAVLAFCRKDIWVQLYNQYKSHIANSSTNRWEEYTIQLDQGIAKRIEEFINSSNGANCKPFRLTKKGVPNSSFIHI